MISSTRNGDRVKEQGVFEKSGCRRELLEGRRKETSDGPRAGQKKRKSGRSGSKDWAPDVTSRRHNASRERESDKGSLVVGQAGSSRSGGKYVEMGGVGEWNQETPEAS